MEGVQPLPCHGYCPTPRRATLNSMLANVTVADYMYDVGIINCPVRPSSSATPCVNASQDCVTYTYDTTRSYDTIRYDTVYLRALKS